MLILCIVLLVVAVTFLISTSYEILNKENLLGNIIIMILATSTILALFYIVLS